MNGWATRKPKSGYPAARKADPKVDEAMKRLGVLPDSKEIKPEA